MKLVLTGAPNPHRDCLIKICRESGLSRAVVSADYLPEKDFSVLLHASKALIFPSLFEGFGMPLLESMACRKPLLVSNATSLPEIGGDAPLYFNPLEPAAMAAAIGRLEDEPELSRALAAKSANRLKAFGGPREMAVRYLEAFRGALGGSL